MILFLLWFCCKGSHKASGNFEHYMIGIYLDLWSRKSDIFYHIYDRKFSMVDLFLGLGLHQGTHWNHIFSCTQLSHCSKRIRLRKSLCSISHPYRTNMSKPYDPCIFDIILFACLTHSRRCMINMKVSKWVDRLSIQCTVCQLYHIFCINLSTGESIQYHK